MAVHMRPANVPAKTVPARIRLNHDHKMAFVVGSAGTIGKTLPLQRLPLSLQVNPSPPADQRRALDQSVNAEAYDITAHTHLPTRAASLPVSFMEPVAPHN